MKHVAERYVCGIAAALAVRSIRRMPALAELPTIDEAGVKGYDNSSWSAVGAPAGTPEQFGDYLKSEIAKFARVVKEAKITAQ